MVGVVYSESCRNPDPWTFSYPNSKVPPSFRFQGLCLAISTSRLTTAEGTEARVLRNQLKQRWDFALLSYFFLANNDGDSDHNVELAGGKVQLITTKDSWDEKLSEARRDGKIVVANFSATWCVSCLRNIPSLIFLTIDVDELTEFSTSWDIKATPTFFFLKDGQQVDKLVGANKPELQKKITAVADSVPSSQNCQT
ncbi:unnamed protein product [Thlaspi arvense]|uniref:Thioredoxin domain-containing protein n=1 Tax=Thlaspi arvense TaxID=13288 RepID=A0AAU9RTB6_THLAR|nr:unnamed protein product [Thlaspi arvense]